MSELALTCALRGCPDCAPGREAWTMFFADGFAWNLTASLLPLVVTLAVVWAIQQALRRADRGDDTGDPS